MNWNANKATPGVPSGGPQVWYGDSASVVLGHVEHVEGGEGGFKTIKFRIFCPDSRLRVKASILFLRDNPEDTSIPVTDNAATLYIGEEEHDRSGKLGAGVICTDVLRDSAGAVIHQSAPLPIPEDPGLEGFTVEFVTAADQLLGIFTSGQDGPTGHWVLQLRFQPDGQRLCDSDWDYVCRKLHATTLGPAIRLIAGE
jgi:hypothetical protein